MENLIEKIAETKTYLEAALTKKIDYAIVAGSGLGFLVDHLENTIEYDYKDIPHFVSSTVIGHEGKLVFGYIGEKYVVVMKGRVHFYEGHPMQTITYPIRLFAKLGIENIILTNACGGMHEAFNGGALMVISDHINLMGTSPLIGANHDDFGTRFPDMSEAYAKEYREKLFAIAEAKQIKLHEGVYAAWAGPAYETPAEIRYIKTIGADAVGMSTVPEVLVARHSGMKVLAISCITNMAAGLSKNHLNHSEVTEVANKLSANMLELVTSFIKEN
ncbi:MAG: purine-nucleoside phosphorylase [Mycoplasmatales bacterium]